jgi:DNA-directed RNA polymerase subunit RPC12/RpoP
MARSIKSLAARPHRAASPGWVEDATPCSRVLPVAGEAMAKEPLKDEAEVEVICLRCGYHLTRTATRLRRDTPVVCPNCGDEVVPEGHEHSGGRTQ